NGLKQTLGGILMAFSAPGIADSPVGVKHGIADHLAAIDGVESTAGIEVRDFGAPANFAFIGRFELGQMTRRLIVNSCLRGVVSGLVIANIHGGHSKTRLCLPTLHHIEENRKNGSSVRKWIARRASKGRPC